MAVQLFKLVIDVTTTTTTDINPDVKRYFYELEEEDVDEGILTIPASKLVDDSGDPLDGQIPVVDPENGYYLLFVNGVLQQSGLYSVSEDEIEVQDIDTETTPPGAPIVLVIASFAPTLDSTTTVIT